MRRRMTRIKLIRPGAAPSIDDIMHASGSGDDQRVQHLTDVLKHFVATHPEKS